ncbi:MAG: ectoine hydroxylase [Acidimicrobiales bacterium]
MTSPVTVADRYPTRTDRPQRQARLDPVVYGSRPGPMSDGERARFEEDGFCAFDRLITDEEVADLLAEVERLASPLARIDPERLVLEPGDHDVRSVFEVHELSPLIARIVADDRLAGRARQVLGSDVYIHQSRVNRKPGFAGTEFAWHSDFETWHAEDGMPAARALSISVALTPNYDCNGSLLIIPGSHKTFLATVGETPEDHYRQSLRRQDIGVPDQASLTRQVEEAGRIATITGAAGSAVMFDCNAMHGSAGNITPYPRCNLFVVYNSVENTLVDPFAAPAPRPEHIASRDFTPVG